MSIPSKAHGIETQQIDVSPLTLILGIRSSNGKVAGKPFPEHTWVEFAEVEGMCGVTTHYFPYR